VTEQGVLTMTQRDRDRLVVLKKAQKQLITQSQAAKELTECERAPAPPAASEAGRRRRQEITSRNGSAKWKRADLRVKGARIVDELKDPTIRNVLGRSFWLLITCFVFSFLSMVFAVLAWRRKH
jgi:hypothetical protein